MNKRYYISPEETISESDKQLKSADIIWDDPSLLEIPKGLGIVKNSPSTRFSTPFFPQSYSCLPPEIPLAILVSPGNEQKVQQFDAESNYIPQCPYCNEFFCSHTKFDPKKNNYICHVCNKTYKQSDKTFNHLNFNVKPTQSYDIVSNQDIINNDNIFLIAIDTSLFSVEINYAQSVAHSLSKIFQEYNFSNDTKTLLLTFDDKIILYDPYKEREFLFTDLDDFTIPNIKKCNLMDCKDFYIKVLNKIQNIDSKKCTYSNCLGSVYNFSTQILKNGGNLIVFSASYTTYGPYVIRRKEDLNGFISYDKRNIKFYSDIARKMNEMSISVHLFYSTDGNEDLNVVGVPSAFSSGSIHTYGYFSQKRDIRVLYSEIVHVLTNSYFFHSDIEVIHPPYLEIRTISANSFQNKTKNKMLLCNYPVTDSFMVDFSFLENKQKKFKIEIPFVSFQILFRYINKENKQITRVITHTVRVTDSITKIKNDADQICILSCLSRRFVDVKFRMSLIASIKVLTFNKDPKIKSLILFFADSPALREKHPLGEDGRTSDLVALKTFNILDLFLYICKRVKYFSFVDKYHPMCMGIQSYSSVAFIISQISTKDYLQKAFGADNFSQIPEKLPVLDTQENKELWEFAKEYTKNPQIVVFPFETT